MRKLILALLLLTAAAFAQTPQTITTTSASTPAGCATLSLSEQTGGVGFYVGGTWTGTLQPEVQVLNQPPTNSYVVPSTSSTTQTTVTGNGTYFFPSSAIVGASIVLICGPTSTGTANIYMLSSTALNILPGSGGGGGAVSSVFGRTGAVTAQTGDYTCAQVTGCVTNAVSSVFGRTGAVVAVSGDYTCTEVTGCVTGGGPAIAGSPVAPPASVTGFNIFGDSIGLGVGVQTSSQVYAQIFANALGLPINNNFSVDGAHQAAFLTQATGVTPSVATGSIAIVGANEIGESAAQPLYIPQYILSAQAFAVWLGLPPANVVQTSGMTFAGTWSDHPLFGIDGKFSGTPGSTATATVSGTTVYVTTFGGISGNFNQSYTVTIDSTVVLTETGFNTYVDSIPLCYRFSGLSAGSHTVVITATGTTPNYATISFIAGNSGTSFPLVVLGNTIQNASVGSDIPTITAMNTALATMVSNLDADGLDVLGVNDYPAITTTATPPEYAVDGVHPNQLGNQLLAQAFLDDMYAGNTAAGLTAQGLAALLQTALNKPPIVSTTTPTSHGFVGELALSSSAPWYFYVNVGVDTWDSVALQPFDTPYGTFGQQNSSAGVVTVAGDAGTNGGEVTFCGTGASPTCFPIQVATTGTTLNFGSNASLTAAGALTVVSCSGCGGGASSVSNSDGTLTISPTTGAVVASLALGHANTWTGTQTFGTITPTTISGGVSFSGTPVLSAGTLTCGVAGTAGCVVTGEGATSGSATLTWPAVAGTTSNPIVSSNYLSTPGLVSASGNLIIAPAQNLLLEPANGDTVEISINGAGGNANAPALTSAEGTTTGIFWPSAASIALSISGAEKSRQVANGFSVGPNAILGATSPGSTADTSLARGVAGRWDIGQSATVTDTTGSIRLSSLQVAGTKFTASGCSNSTTVGGATAGSFVSGTTGTCTVTITMGDSDTAPNGWSCTASDQTTPANLISQKTGGSTTTAVITGTTVSADVISFHCLAY